MEVNVLGTPLLLTLRSLKCFYTRIFFSEFRSDICYIFCCYWHILLFWLPTFSFPLSDSSCYILTFFQLNNNKIPPLVLFFCWHWKQKLNYDFAASIYDLNIAFSMGLERFQIALLNTGALPDMKVRPNVSCMLVAVATWTQSMHCGSFRGQY